MSLVSFVWSAKQHIKVEINALYHVLSCDCGQFMSSQFSKYTIKSNWPQGASQSVQYATPSILGPLIQTIEGGKICSTEKTPRKKLQEGHKGCTSCPRTEFIMRCRITSITVLRNQLCRYLCLFMNSQKCPCRWRTSCLSHSATRMQSFIDSRLFSLQPKCVGSVLWVLWLVFFLFLDIKLTPHVLHLSRGNRRRRPCPNVRLRPLINWLVSSFLCLFSTQKKITKSLRVGAFAYVWTPSIIRI